jgi:hypothetical protein
MFNIPELNWIMSGYMDQADLASAAQVRSEWHSGFALFVWSKIPAFTVDSRQHKSFYLLVSEDHEYHRQKEEEQERKKKREKEDEVKSMSSAADDARQSSSMPSVPAQLSGPTRLPAFTRYGGRITEICSTANLLQALSTPPTGIDINLSNDPYRERCCSATSCPSFLL